RACRILNAIWPAVRVLRRATGRSLVQRRRNWNFDARWCRESGRLIHLAAKYQERTSGDDVQQLKRANADVPHLAFEILPDADDSRSTVRFRIGNLHNR